MSLRIPEDVRAAIDEAVQRTGRPFASVANEILAEGVRMRRVPGIVFDNGVFGRVVRVAGSGLEVFEIVRTYRELDEDWEALREAYYWLTDDQLRAALTYAEAYPAEVEARLQREEHWTPETTWATYPFMKPPTCP